MPARAGAPRRSGGAARFDSLQTRCGCRRAASTSRLLTLGRPPTTSLAQHRRRAASGAAGRAGRRGHLERAGGREGRRYSTSAIASCSASATNCRAHRRNAAVRYVASRRLAAERHLLCADRRRCRSRSARCSTSAGMTNRPDVTAIRTTARSRRSSISTPAAPRLPAETGERWQRRPQHGPGPASSAPTCRSSRTSTSRRHRIQARTRCSTSSTRPCASPRRLRRRQLGRSRPPRTGGSCSWR